MSEYMKKRIDYINNWPLSEPFDIEMDYKKAIDIFVEENKCFPYRPMQLWESDNKEYNYVVSFIIDALDVLNEYPHHAYAFMFRGIDQYGKFLFNESKENICLKKMADKFADLMNRNSDINIIFENVFSNMPFSVCKFLYGELYKTLPDGVEGKAHFRVINDENNHPDSDREVLIKGIYSKYGYDPDNYAESIRQGSRLLKLVFNNSSIELNGQNVNISNRTKLHILLSGVLYSLRNDYMHGLAISSSKSSMASLSRYALNYYCFLTASFITDLLLIYGDSTIDQEKKYTELKMNVIQNYKNMNILFGKHIDK